MRKLFRILAFCSIFALVFALVADAPAARGAPTRPSQVESAVYYAQLVPTPAMIVQNFAVPEVSIEPVLTFSQSGVETVAISLNVAQPNLIIEAPALPAFDGEIIVALCSSITQPAEITGTARACDVQEVVALAIEKVGAFSRSSCGFAKEAMRIAYVEMLGAVETNRSPYTIRI